MQTFDFFKLPPEIRLAFLKHLDPKTLTKMGRVSHEYKEYVEKEKSLWRPYLKPEAIDKAKKNNQSLSVLFGSNLESLTEEGLLIHPKYGPLYQSLKAKVDDFPSVRHKVYLLENEGVDKPDTARMILSNNYFQQILLKGGAFGIISAKSIINAHNNDELICLALEWVLQPKVLQEFAPTASERTTYTHLWISKSVKLLDVALRGLQNQCVINLLEEYALQKPFLVIYKLFGMIAIHKDYQLALLLLKTFMEKEALLDALCSQELCLGWVNYLQSALELVERLDFPSFEASKKEMKDILNRIIGLLEKGKTTDQENPLSTTTQGISRLSL